MFHRSGERMRAEALVKQVKTIFSLPEIVIQINEVLRQPEPNLMELESIIVHDPGLTASILKVVNSSYYSFPAKVDTLSKAITIIGLSELSAIVMGTAVTHRFKGIESTLMNMDIFWYHSVTRGVLAKNLALRGQCGNTERFFIAGLLSSIGKLILFTQYPQQSAEMMRTGLQQDADLAAAERQAFGFDYAELSAELLKAWQLPSEIWEMIAYQLNPLQSPNHKTDACILHVASAIAGSIQPCVSYDIHTQPLDAVFNPGVLEYLNLAQEEVQSISLEALLQAMDVIGVLRPETMVIF